MGKSAEAYYAERLQRLLEQQAAQRQQNPRLSSPPPLRNSTKTNNDKAAGDGRAYYDGFRTRMQQKPQSAGQVPRQRTGERASSEKKLHGDLAGDSRQQQAGRPKANTRQHPSSGTREKWTDKPQEEKTRVEAFRHASQGRRRRKLREVLISVVLMFGVFLVLCIVTYQLLFVIRDLDATGSSRYSTEEILAASGVDMGDHLYSFSSRITREAIMLNCPYVAAVDVQRTPPGSIAFQIEEEEPMFYAVFYGETWEVSRSLRVLDPISESDAKEQGLIKLKLPGVREAISGRKIAFADTRVDTYMETVLEALRESDLAGRIGVVDLRSAYAITMVCDEKYKLLFGDVTGIETKFRLAVAVLEDQLFHGDNKASVDLRDLNATSVIIDNQLDLE